jgi:hypothetical protein
MKNLSFGIVIIGIVLMQSCAMNKLLTIPPKSKVVTVKGKTKNELYIRANTWMVETFNNAKSVIQFSDKENGIVTGKYIMATIITSTTTTHEIYSIIKIQVKDEAARITITPESYKSDANFFAGGKNYPIEQMNSDIDMLINNFSKSIIETENNSW